MYFKNAQTYRLSTEWPITLEALHAIHNAMIAQIQEAGGSLDAVFEHPGRQTFGDPTGTEQDLPRLRCVNDRHDHGARAVSDGSAVGTCYGA